MVTSVKPYSLSTAAFAASAAIGLEFTGLDFTRRHPANSFGSSGVGVSTAAEHSPAAKLMNKTKTKEKRRNFIQIVFGLLFIRVQRAGGSFQRGRSLQRQVQSVDAFSISLATLTPTSPFT